jgi:hypothetical protein
MFRPRPTPDLETESRVGVSLQEGMRACKKTAERQPRVPPISHQEIT